MKLADTLDLGSNSERSAGSSPVGRTIYGLVAQPGERCVRNAEVEGSIPFKSTNDKSPDFSGLFNINFNSLCRFFICINY